MVFIYEDDQWQNLLPLVHLRPVFDLRCGCRTLLEKYQALYPSEKLGLLVRPDLAALAAEQHPDSQVGPVGLVGQIRLVRHSKTSVLFLSGRAILDKPLPVRGSEEVFVNGTEIVGFRVNPARLRSSSHQPPATSDRRKLLGQPLFSEAEKGTVGLLKKPLCGLLTQTGQEPATRNRLGIRALRVVPSAGTGNWATKTEFFNSPTVPSFRVRSWRLPERKVLASIVKFPWNLIEFNESELVRELRLPPTAYRLPPTAIRRLVVVGNPRNLKIAGSAQVDPGVVFDLRLGRILIDEQAQIRARSVVAGPCYVGPGTVLDAALVRPGCSFGPGCRIGGEVEASIFLGHANKHHEGFIGHAIVAEWVNLGAMTTNSDLRNDYGEVKVLVQGATGNGDIPPRGVPISPRLRNTGLRKFGSVIADHAKTAIGSLLNTGAVLGIFANWFEPGLSPKAIPDFGRGSKGVGKLDELIDTARIVMSRRGVRLSPVYERLVRRIYAQKKSEV
jgi:UDP-N-acetylglucosamine diphosphorylase/glucosamine-1-phosphate N-acetyltransferase